MQKRTTLTVEQVFSSGIGYHHREVETVSGFLVVSRHLTFLCPSAEAAGTAILVVAPGLLDKWLQEMSPMFGTMVAFAGRATVRGHLARSGLAPCPYAFSHVVEIKFRDQQGNEASYGR